MCKSTTNEASRRVRVQALATSLYQERRDYLLRIARANGASRADAEEAVNQSFLAFLLHFNPDGDAPPLPWVTLTLRRECWAKYRREHLELRAAQEATADSGEPGVSLDAIPSQAPGTEEAIERSEETLEARRRLAQLKPAERRALGLLAAGYSYKEIGAISDWTHTKVNRSLAEGRAALRAAA